MRFEPKEHHKWQSAARITPEGTRRRFDLDQSTPATGAQRERQPSQTS